jgi:hypothetical protein
MWNFAVSITSKKKKKFFLVNNKKKELQKNYDIP